MGVESFISANHFQYPRTRKMISENCISFSWSEENIVIMHWIEFGKFTVLWRIFLTLTEFNVLFNN